jgi:protein prenyltransferase alpha subunit repeat containing protein 1
MYVRSATRLYYANFIPSIFRASFEIIPMASNENKSPIVHVEHHLGVQSWCIKFIYEYAHKVIIKYKQDNMKFHWSFTDGNDAIMKYLNCAILINPDVSTFWNIRRQLFGKNRLDITKEFQFTAIVLSKKPKSNEAFSYRRWLYSYQSKLKIIRILMDCTNILIRCCTIKFTINVYLLITFY